MKAELCLCWELKEREAEPGINVIIVTMQIALLCNGGDLGCSY